MQCKNNIIIVNLKNKTNLTAIFMVIRLNKTLAAKENMLPETTLTE